MKTFSSFMKNERISMCSFPQKSLNRPPAQCGLCGCNLHYCKNYYTNLVLHNQFILLLLLPEITNYIPTYEPNESKHTIELYS